mgnify:CR=1 FL=1
MKLTRICHTAWRKYGDVLGINNGWVTVRFDGEKGTRCYELDESYIKEVGYETN